MKRALIDDDGVFWIEGPWPDSKELTKRLERIKKIRATYQTDKAEVKTQAPFKDLIRERTEGEITRRIFLVRDMVTVLQNSVIAPVKEYARAREALGDNWRYVRTLLQEYDRLREKERT